MAGTSHARSSRVVHFGTKHEILALGLPALPQRWGVLANPTLEKN
jgi:hypothetical protein